MSNAAPALVQSELVLGRYRPLRPLGSGGSGSVWLARDEQNGLDVALKMVPREGKAASRAEREAEAARLMPVKKPPDTGKSLLCPMPGLVRSIEVEEGQEVKAGETLAVVEAMKMENVLRAERDGVVKAIKVSPGDSLAVDAVIMEFA